MKARACDLRNGDRFTRERRDGLTEWWIVDRVVMHTATSGHLVGWVSFDAALRGTSAGFSIDHLTSVDLEVTRYRSPDQGLW